MKLTQKMNLVTFRKEVDRVPTRNGFGEGLVIAGEKNKDVVVLCADLTESTRCHLFREKFPDRFVEMGVAEQNLATIGSGMAAAGKIPFIASYAMFSPGRNWEQIRTTVCLNNQPVKIVGAHAGISVGPDGASHQALEDVNIMRALPGMTILVPTDAIEAKKATIAAAKHKGPVYIRLAREKTPVITTEDTPFKIGDAQVYVENGHDVLIIAMGPMVYEAIMAAKELDNQGIHATVINCHTVKPIDSKTILKYAEKCECIVTAEEHNKIGGLGSAVAEVVTAKHPTPVVRVAVDDKFGQSGAPDELMDLYGLRAKDIVKAAKEAVKLKFGHSAKSAMKVPTPPRGEHGQRLASKALEKVEKSVAFISRSGHVIHSLPELHKAVLNMPRDDFKHHVNENRHDFAQWVEDVHEDHELARALRQTMTKSSVVNLLGTRIGQYHSTRLK
jgi:transketolase